MPNLTYTAYDVYGVAYQQYYSFDELVKIFTASTTVIDLVASVDLQKSSDVRRAIKTVLMANPSFISTNSYISLINKLKVLPPPFAAQGQYYYLNTFFANCNKVLNYVDRLVIQAIPAVVFNSIYQMQGVPLKTDVYSKMSSDQLKGLTLNSVILNNLNFNAMPVDFFTSLTDEQLIGLPTSKFAEFTPGQVANLRRDMVSYYMTQLHFSALTPTALAGFTAEQIGWIPRIKMYYFSPAFFAALTPTQVRGLTLLQMQFLKPEQIASFSPSAIAVLSSGHIYKMQPETLGALTDPQLNSLTKEAIFNGASRMVTERVFFFVTYDTGYYRMETHLVEDDRGISARGAAGLKAHQIKVLGNKIAYLGVEAIAALSADAIKAISPGQISLLTEAQINGQSSDPEVSASGVARGLTTGHIALLTKAQLDAFTYTQLSCFTRDQVLALTPAQRNSLNSTEIYVFERIAPGFMATAKSAALTAITQTIIQASSSLNIQTGASITNSLGVSSTTQAVSANSMGFASYVPNQATIIQ